MPPTRRTRQQPLSHGRIVATALGLLTRVGLPDLTMRAIGTELGLPDGGTLPELRRAVEAAGLRECPPAVAPLLRLVTLDQATAPDSVLRHGRAPDGSAHVLSPSLGDEPGVHRGLYLRVVDHVPRLRGFTCDDLHVFGPEDRWILAL